MHKKLVLMYTLRSLDGQAEKLKDPAGVIVRDQSHGFFFRWRWRWCC
jgi:hypothetical protein